MSPPASFAVVIRPPFDFDPLYQPFDEDYLERQVDRILSEQASLEEAGEELNDLDMQRSPKPQEASESIGVSTSQGFTPPSGGAPDFEDEGIFASVSEAKREEILKTIAKKPFLLECPARQSERIKFTDQVSALATDAGIDQVNADALVEYVRQIYFHTHDLTMTEANRFTFGDEINDMEVESITPIKRKRGQKQRVAKPGRFTKRNSQSDLAQVDTSTNAQAELMINSNAAMECPLDVNPVELKGGHKGGSDNCRKQKCSCIHDVHDQIPRRHRPRANSSAKRACAQEDEANESGAVGVGEPANAAEACPVQMSAIVHSSEEKPKGRQITQLDDDQKERKKLKNKQKRKRRNEKKNRASMNLNESANAANIAQASSAQSSVFIDLTGRSLPPERPQQSEGQQITQPDHNHDQNQREKPKSKRKREGRDEGERHPALNPAKKGLCKPAKRSKRVGSGFLKANDSPSLTPSDEVKSKYFSEAAKDQIAPVKSERANGSSMKNLPIPLETCRLLRELNLPPEFLSDSSLSDLTSDFEVDIHSLPQPVTNPGSTLSPPRSPLISHSTDPTSLRFAATSTDCLDWSPQTPRKKYPKFSPYFPLVPTDPGSCLPFPPIDAPSFGLVQEQLAHDPFRLLIATIFLNRTRGGVALPVLFQVFERYPTIEAMANASPSHLVSMIRCLGFQNQRARKCITLAQTWLTDPPTPNKRYRKMHYPREFDGRNISRGECIDQGDLRVAWEVAHLPGVGAYSLDSWRIFCRDELRGLATDWMGTGAREVGFVPEWKCVLPQDKELRAYLTWMWLKEEWVWDHNTGDLTAASEKTMRAARSGGVAHEEDGNWVLETSPVKAMNGLHDQ